MNNLKKESWVSIDLTNRVFYHPSFIIAMEHLRAGLIIMPEHYYRNTYKEIITQ